MSDYNKEKNYWDKYYKEKHINIIINSNFSSYVYDKYLKPNTDKNIVLRLADLGCGNMRDSHYFSKNGCFVYAIDKSFNVGSSVVQYKKNFNLNPITADVNAFLQNGHLRTLMDVIYMRWFLHAVPYDIGSSIFKNSVDSMKPGALICIEVRSYNDEILKKESSFDGKDLSYRTTHKRWLYGMERLNILCSQHDVEIIEMVEQRGFSKTEESDPLLIRFIGRKKLINHFEKSDNFKIYKPITEKMLINTKNSYEDLKIFNKIMEENKIKYVSVAGTTLGLCRHGGIIPWDNDIDLGFTKSNWMKLRRIHHILEQAGLKFRSHGPKHGHYGTIDVFLLTQSSSIVSDNNVDFYIGDAKTICTMKEYKRVVKQLFGPTYVYAPLENNVSLKTRYGDDYYHIGDVNDNFHYKNKNVKRFTLTCKDRTFRCVFT